MSNRLIKHLPSYYKNSKVIADITDTQNEEIEKFIKSVKDTFNQFFIDTADSSLERWERELGIPVNNAKENEYRRSAIKSKLKGSGTVTVDLIKNVCKSYNDDEVDIIEDNSNMRFIVKFLTTKGKPTYIDDLKKVLEEIKPAHLQLDFEYIYNPNSYLKNYHLGWLNAFTNKELRTISIPDENEGLTHKEMGNFTHQRLEVILHED
ncbi:putative phage tail protein [Wukongibacter sp. M2B1]|uniref:putative phage tail protein n=1 Tax=Wukongibacter sp. M2B1 TaxID=3088895 RepID=UPI003D7B7F58